MAIPPPRSNKLRKQLIEAYKDGLRRGLVLKEKNNLDKDKFLKEANEYNHLNRTIDEMLRDVGLMEELSTIIDEAISVPHEKFEDDYDAMTDFNEIKGRFVADVIEQSKIAIIKIINNSYQSYVDDANDILSYYMES